MKHARWVALGASFVCFALAVALPAAHMRSGVGKGDIDQPGLFFLGCGWAGPLIGQFAWFANPLLFASWLLLALGRHRIATVMASVATLVAADSWMLFRAKIPENEGGVGGLELLYFQPGFYLWLTSFIIIVGGGIFLMCTETPGNGADDSSDA